MMFQNLSGVIGNIQAGKLRALAVSTPERVAAIPDVPTVAEAGYPAPETVVGWSGVWGPPGMDQTASDKWVEVLGKLKDDKAWNKLTRGLGSMRTTPSSRRRWTRLARGSAESTGRESSLQA